MEMKVVTLETDKEMNVCDIDTLEEAKRIVRDLRQKTRGQAQQLLVWKRAYKTQELLISRLQKEKVDQLKTISSKLLLFESRLIRKQKDISTMLNLREAIIHKQQQVIENLTSKILDSGLEPPQMELIDLDTNLLDLDSLNDSDSAVVMEDAECDNNLTNFSKFRSVSSDSIPIMRSVSDAIDPSLKYGVRRNNGFLRRPEILETVYSVEEDIEDTQSDYHKIDIIKKRDAFASGSSKAICNIEDATFHKDLLKEEVCSIPSWPYVLDTSCQNILQSKDHKSHKTHSNQVSAYNRVMSNHRSVTKPKDVKYKRINKAKSKSLEELRGRLKNWVEQGNIFNSLTLEHSQSFT